ncbi:hypothetical protein PFISCL1PPCAC_1148, partial [Pristionchus fissidentatus]
NIEFNRRDGTYLPGKKVTAVVTVTSSRDSPVRSLRLSVIGKAKTYWYNDSKDKYYGATVNYLELKKTLWTPPNEVATQGNHSFRYSFTLPSSCPPSLFAESASIHYYCKAVVIRPDRYRNVKKTKVFRMINKLDLDPDNGLLQKEIDETLQ